MALGGDGLGWVVAGGGRGGWGGSAEVLHKQPVSVEACRRDGTGSQHIVSVRLGSSDGLASPHRRFHPSGWGGGRGSVEVCCAGWVDSEALATGSSHSNQPDGSSSLWAWVGSSDPPGFVRKRRGVRS